MPKLGLDDPSFFRDNFNPLLFDGSLLDRRPNNESVGGGKLTEAESLLGYPIAIEKRTVKMFVFVGGEFVFIAP